MLGSKERTLDASQSRWVCSCLTLTEACYGAIFGRQRLAFSGKQSGHVTVVHSQRKEPDHGLSRACPYGQSIRNAWKGLDLR